MKTFAILAVAVLGCASAWAQRGDKVVMQIDGEPVSLAEFEYSLNKNSGDSLETSYDEIRKYADMYLNYKLKVHAARDAQLDTLSSFQKEYATYRDLQLRPYLKDEEFIDSVAREAYSMIEAQLGDSDLVLALHFFQQLPQNANEETIARKQARIDSVYEALLAGADFGTLCQELSDDKMTSQKGGELPWLGPGQTLPEFEQNLYALQPGEISRPFKSTAGLHILKMVERKKLEPYEERKDEIVGLLVQRGINTAAAEHKIATLMEQTGEDREAILAQTLAQASETDPQLPLLVQEYYDGLLMYEASKRLVWDPARVDTAGLQKHFKANKKSYAWSSPRFKGFSIQAHSQELMEQILAFMKKNKIKDDSRLALLHTAFKDSARAYKIKYGVFAKGDDPVVDYHEYNGEAPSAKRFTVFLTKGKMQKAPKEWRDAEAAVKKDYQDLKEQEWVDELRNRYSWTISEDALGEVNRQ